MQQHGTIGPGLCLFQNQDHFIHIMTIKGPGIVDAQIVKQCCGWGKRGQLRDLKGGIAGRLVRHMVSQMGQKMLQRACGWGNRHIVVVQDGDQAASLGTGIIQPLIGHPTGDCAVANNSHYVIVMSLEIPCRGESQACGYRSGTVRRAKRVKDTFFAICETGQTAPLAYCTHGVATTRQNFMGITLVADIPNNLILRRIQCEMQGDG